MLALVRHAATIRSHAQYAPLDVMPEPFLFDLHWSARELAAAVLRSQALSRHCASTTAANDTSIHRADRRNGFLCMPPLPLYARIGC